MRSEGYATAQSLTFKLFLTSDSGLTLVIFVIVFCILLFNYLLNLLMKKNLLPIIVLVSVQAIAGCANANLVDSTPPSISVTDATATQTTAQTFDYQDYADVLRTYVNDQGLVDYSGLQANREQLDRFNQSLGTVTPQTYSSWSETEQIAFLINAYNAFTLQSIIDQNPLKESIKDISGVWNRREFSLAGETRTLDNIEHDLLRKNFNEPRIHVALVCAAISCPILSNEPYLPSTLDTQLVAQTARFAASPQGFSLDREEQKVYLSSIFKWYGQDFEQTYGIEDKFNGNSQQQAVLNYLNPALDSGSQMFLEQEDYDVKYLDYDWSLNKQ
jgi:hypothetical protein